MRKILVLRGGALGDFIVTLPALASLRNHWPDARMELVGNAVAAEIARRRGLIDTVHSQHEARWSALFARASLPTSLVAWLAEFDLVINYWPDPDDELRSHFPARTGQTFLTAPAMPQVAPAAKHYCEPLRELGLETREFWFRLHPLDVFYDRGRPASAVPVTDGAEFIAIHPGSGSPRKNWPRQNWLALIEQLPCPVVLILGEAESAEWNAERLAGLLGASARPQIQLLVQRPLEELIGVLSRCRMFVGHDSGISHLAAGCGAPCVVLFGSTEPEVWAPAAPNVRTIRAGRDLNSIAVRDVRAAVAAGLADQK